MTADLSASSGPSAPGVSELAEVLGEHVWRDVLGDYEIAPYYKHFGCSCGWKQNIAGMSGWRSWVAAHSRHVAEVIAASGVVVPAAEVREVAESLEVFEWQTPCETRGDRIYALGFEKGYQAASEPIRALLAPLAGESR